MTTESSTTENTDIRPFTITIPGETLDDLRERLARTRLPQPAPGDSWAHGTPTSHLAEMVERWQAFDWREQEARMNAVPNFVTEVDGQTIHFVHVRTDPEAYGGRAEDAFHVVVPSMPGVAFSTPVVDDGWTMDRVARAYDVLMRRLGYASYGAHGSDAGAMVGRELAVLDPEGFLGAHVLQLFSFPSGDPAELEHFGPEEDAALEFAGWFQSVGGYNQMNGTRPQTIAAALSDSPVGQLAYNELFESFGNGTSLVTPEQVLTQVSLYWLTNTSAGAVRYHYAEQHPPREAVVSTGRLGVAVFQDDFRTIRPLAERDNRNIVHWTEHDRGGHYAALEVPEAVVEDLRLFFATA